MKIQPLLIAIYIVFHSVQSFALPKFSLQEKKRCYSCHFNKNGGGPLNDQGKFFSQHRTLDGFRVAEVTKKKPEVLIAKREKPPVITPEIEKEKAKEVIREEEEIKVVSQKKPGETLLDRTSLGADMVMAFLVDEENGAPQNFFLMKAEPQVSTRVTDDFLTVFGYNFATPVLTAYGQYAPGNYYAQVGSFHLPFGLDALDYNNTVGTLIKEHYDLALDTRDVGLELGYRRDFYGRMAVVNGARQPRQRPTLKPTFDRDLGYVFDIGYQGLFFEVPFLLGTSFLAERRIPPGLPVTGIPSEPIDGKRAVTTLFDFYGQLNYKRFGLIGELTTGRNTPLRGDHTYGFYFKPSFNIYHYWNVAFRGELFSQDRQYLGDSRIRYVFSSEYQFSKYISIEGMVRVNEELGNIPVSANNDAIMLLTMKF